MGKSYATPLPRLSKVLLTRPMKAPKAFSGTFVELAGHQLGLKPITIQVVCTSTLRRSKTRKISNRHFTLTSKASCLGFK